MNHLALNAAGRAEVDAIVAEAARHGWTLMFADRHPYAGGPQHYAAFLHNDGRLRAGNRRSQTDDA